MATSISRYNIIYPPFELESIVSQLETISANYTMLSPFYNMKVEGGGIIFFDWKYGFTGATTTGTNGCSVAADTTSDLGNYYYDFDAGCVKCGRVGSKHRFYVVAESDLTDSTVGWDTVTYSTSRATSTDFGTGKANTTLLCNNITDTNSFWPTVKTARATNPSGHTLVSDDSALDTRWFVPSKDELYVLNAMQYSDSAYRPSGIPQLSINYSSGTLNIYYWSSSQISGNAYRAWDGDFHYGRMYYGLKGNTTNIRVRLCRTF